MQMKRIPPHWVAIIHDLVMAALSFVVVHLLQSGSLSFEEGSFFIKLGVFIIISGGTFSAFKFYRGLWRYASLRDVLTMIKAASVVVVLYMFYIISLGELTQSMVVAGLINWLLLIAFLSGPRFGYRMLKDKVLYPQWHEADQVVHVILAGIDDDAEMFIRKVHNAPVQHYKITGIIDQNPKHRGRSIHRVPIIGDFKSLPSYLEKCRARNERLPDRLVVTNRKMDRDILRELVALAQSSSMRISFLPDLSRLDEAQHSIEKLQPVELEDLLGRAPAQLDREAMRSLIKDKNILITGAGGTIGKELSLQIASYQPASMLLLENSEYNLYHIDKELQQRYATTGIFHQSIMGDVRDRESLLSLFQAHQIDLVFHAAALKHVPLLEHNITQAILTNIMGTVNVADCCRQYGVQEMVLISTDKAVKPVSIMGATKRIAEDYCQALGQLPDTKTVYTTVRFGNVLGSSGSVIPLFQQQLEQGGPLTITHPDVKRYFMTVQEAVELILQAACLKPGEGNHSAIYVLDMGESIKIHDLAEHMIRLAGLEPGKDIQIEYIGLRPGEKIDEELFFSQESPTKAAPGVFLAASRNLSYNDINHIILELIQAAYANNNERVNMLLKKLVPEL